MNYKKIGEKAGNYALYVIPGYGIYDQFFKKSKKERSTLGVIGSGIWTAFFLVKAALLPAYISKGVSTGNWHPFKFNKKEKTEQVIENKKDGGLENSIKLLEED